MLGYSSNEVTGKTIEDVLIGTESLTSALNSAKNGIPTHNLGNLSLHHRDGHSFPAQIQTIPVVVDGDVSDIVIILCDHSEDEQVRVRTQQLEQRALLGEVTAIFAHEVRNPINNISVGLQVLANNLANDSGQVDLVNRALNDCSRLTALMNSVLQFSKATEYKMEATDIKALIQRLLERWRPRFSNANIQSFIQSTLKSPKVTGDARALEQVFTNLISNSVNAMRDKGGLLAIKIDPQTEPEDPPQMLITVTDNGPGIPEDIREHIFEPFVTSNSQQGTGLGLAITRGIVNAHHGSIHVDSFPGGTIFTIKLPIALEEV
jgi:signal transduction histidine kinase